MSTRPKAGLVFLVLVVILTWASVHAQPAGSCGCDGSLPAEPGSTVRITLGDLDSSSGLYLIEVPDRDGLVTAAYYPVQRSYLLYVPKNYVLGDPAPLLVAFHGWTSSASSIQRGSGFNRTADSFNTVVAYPEGIDYPSAGRGWAFPGCYASPPVGTVDPFGRRAVCEVGDTYNCDTATPSWSPTCPNPGVPTPWSDSALLQCTDTAEDIPLSSISPECEPSQIDCTMNQTPPSNCNWCGCVDDEIFARAVIFDAARRLCIDPLRVYAAGMSAGGMFASWLIGPMSDVLAASVPFSGTNPRDFYSLPEAGTDISAMWIHGTSDTVVPYDGSAASDGYRYEDIRVESKRLASSLGNCSAEMAPWPEPAQVRAPSSAELSCGEYACIGSSTAQEAVYCTWNGGHSWPKSAGRREEAYWGNRLMFAFLESHAKNDFSPWLQQLTSCSPSGVLEVCDDRVDNDGDGLVDCLDPDCSNTCPSCTLGQAGDPCTQPSDCCSGKCTGKSGRKLCR